MSVTGGPKQHQIQPAGPLKGAVCEDGGLYDLGWYLGWTPGDDNATLDGRFTADDLEAIAAHMRANTSG